MLITANSTEGYVRRNAGGKAANLFFLSRSGFPVPEWVGLGADVFETFKEQARIRAVIEELLRQPPNPAETSQHIRELILHAPYPSETRELIKQAYGKLASPVIAVRSSALEEDSAKYSFAGQLSSFLYVETLEETLTKVKEVWASAYSERSLSYRLQHEIPLEGHIRVGVILQEMVDSRKSGVLFSCDPTTGNGAEIMVNAVYGVGEGLVSGALEPDVFVLDKDTGRIVSQDIVAKEKQFVRKPGGGVQESVVDEALRTPPCLDESELRSLWSLGVRIEAYYRFPQDIEWGFANAKLYLLQARPVTTPFTAAEGNLYIWDNSNIVESYGGITLPLTFTFARFVYHQVYVQFCEILMLPRRQIQKMDFFLRNMLGSFYGRVYYNMLNWYRLTSILPGFAYNRQFMETMMGTPHELPAETTRRLLASGFRDRWLHRLRAVLTGFKFFYFHLTIQSLVNRFMDHFNATYRKFRSIDYSRMPADEIYGHYQELERTLLWRWQAPIINDYLCMVHFGVMNRLARRWLSELGPSIQNDLLCGEGNMESAEPMRELIRMADYVLHEPDLSALIEKTRPEDCLEMLQHSPDTEFCEQVRNYIDKYGYRCMSEMKLEQKDLYQDPTFLFVCLKNYLKSGLTNLEEYDQRERKIRSEAETRVGASLTGLKKMIFFWSLKHARRAVRNRENTRFCRTRIYGVVRAMFYGIGKDYTLRQIIERPEDIFYLTLDEVAGSLEGWLTVQDLSRQIALRKEEYTSYEDLEPASRFLTHGPVYWMNDHFPQAAEEAGAADLPENALKGIGCCPGTVRGVAKVILTPEDDMELNGQILVTRRTDPGWIPLYPSAEGLLVERGGLLSHSAIVAREMGLPTIVGVKGLTERVKTGMTLQFDGQTGIVIIE